MWASHHVEPWASTGRTSLDQTVLLCAQTHNQLHRGLTVTLKDGRRLNENGWVE